MSDADGSDWPPESNPIYRTAQLDAEMLEREEAEAAEAAKGCPDGGFCHHECEGACFRVLTAGPLSGVYPDDRWPKEIRVQHGRADIVRSPLNTAIRAEFATAYFRVSQSASLAARRTVAALEGVLDYTELLQGEAADTPFEVATRAISNQLYATIAAALEIDLSKEG